MKIVMLGMQGSGKGTQAKMIAEKYSWQHISTGDIFRENMKNDTELGKEAKKYVNNGKLVPDELTIRMVEDYLKDKDDFILDGFPRNLEQTKALAGFVKLDKVLHLKITDEEAVKRLSARWQCKACGAVFNTNSKQPKEKGKCDTCGDELYQRDDDKPDAIKERLKIYHGNFDPIISFYFENGILVDINGEQPIEKVFEELVKVLD